MELNFEEIEKREYITAGEVLGFIKNLSTHCRRIKQQAKFNPKENPEFIFIAITPEIATLAFMNKNLIENSSKVKLRIGVKSDDKTYWIEIVESISKEETL